MISVDVPFGFLSFTNPKKRENLTCRYGSLFSALQLHAYIAYLFAIGLEPFLRGMDLKLGLAYMCTNFLSFSLWYSVNRQERRIRRLVRMQGSLLPHRGTKKTVRTRDYCILSFLTLFPLAYAGFNVYLFFFCDIDMSFYSFGYQIQNPFINFFVMFFGSYGYCLVFSKWPCMALWSMCHTLNEGANILHIYDRKINLYFLSRLLTKRDISMVEGVNGTKEYPHVRNTRDFRDYPLKRLQVVVSNANSSLFPSESTLDSVRTFSSNGVNTDEGRYLRSLKPNSRQTLKEILMEYFEILKMIRVLKDTVSLPSFFITMLSFSSLYTILAILFFGLMLNLSLWREVLCKFFIGFSIIVSLGYCGAKIPQRMYDIKSTCSDIINANEIDGALSSKELLLLKRVEMVDLVHTSACEFVVFSRSFIVTSFGSILTFGLLIINLK